jgi:SET domain-containing protein
MLAENLIMDLEERVYCRLQPSPIHGIGVFAIRTNPKGINPFVSFAYEDFEGVTTDKILKNKNIHPNVKKYVQDMCALQDGKIYLYDLGMNAINIAYYLNHSDNPNMIEENDGEVFRTKKEIKVGEELTVDYTTYNDKLPF